MPHPQFDRSLLKIKPLSERKDKVHIERDQVPPGAAPKPLTDRSQKLIEEASDRIRAARAAGRPRMLAFGAHAIKNGLAPVFTKLIEDGWITHLATNGAGIIHDWEFAFQGHSSEDVRANVPLGEFGTWEETGFYLNLAINLGACQGLGYGEAIGALVERGGLHVPARAALLSEARAALDAAQFEQAAAIADLLHVLAEFDLPPGWMDVPHPFKRFGLQAAAFRLGIPYTGHPMIGHDIIYVHPMNHGAAIGRAAQRDFLAFAHAVANIDGGVYLSIGSAVMSPMVFEKSMSMAQNLARQRGAHIDSHYILVVDLQESHWDWTLGEPPENNPDYYLRYNKSFSRMGGTMRYMTADNRDFLLALVQSLATA